MAEEEKRPSPEELLDRYGLRDSRLPEAMSVPSSDGHVPRRGRLRVFLGMAAGVGKTYAMLGEGRRRKGRGTDVVIGYVEAHGRPLTEAQIGDLEVIPRQKITYRGVTLEEMDIDAILKRRPAVVLVDELAHTNVPGSRNQKRYQDVEELLAAGITVITTVNIQHLEGLNDLIESITGVRQRETLPDQILDKADEVELVDIAPDALRARMRHGNIYPAERAQKALQHYFTQSNLTALRELALRRMVEKTESQLEAMMAGQEREEQFPRASAAVADRVMVAFDGRPHARQLLREGFRLARALKAPLLAVTVVRPHEGVTSGNLDTPKERALREYTELAEDLGAEVVRIEGRDVAKELAHVARERHVTHLIIGTPGRPRWRELLFGSVVNRLLREPTNADIHVVPHRPQQG
jgi:two-component system, OmpR family, sensor histidine kinase KdpD